MNQPDNQTYALRRSFSIPYAEAVDKITAALKAEGFGVLTEIDVQATLKTKIDVDFRRYVILGACNPHLAHRALSAELEVGLLLPCNVVVYERESGSEIMIADPIAMLGIADAPGLQELAVEAKERLERALQAV